MHQATPSEMQRSNISNKTNMDDSYQQMFHTFRKSRVNRSTIWRRQLKERDPEKYRRYLDQQRVRSQIARNRLKSAISIVKNSPKSITNKYDRQKRLSSDKLRAYQWKIAHNSVDARILAKLATNVSSISEKVDEEPKIVLDKLADQLKVFKYSHILPSGLHMREAKTLLRVTSKYYWSSLTEDIKKWVSECEVCQKLRQYQNDIVQLPNENPSWKETNSMQTTSDCGVWSRESIELLLRSLTQYFMMKPSHITSESELWMEISNKMKLLGLNTTSLQCQQKWQELKQKYVHLKMSKNSSESSNQVWPFLGVLNMMYYAFQNPRLEGSSSLPSPFDSVFAIDVDGANSSVDLLSSCDSHIIPDSFSSRILLDNYRDVSTVENTENLLQDHIDNQADRIWQNNVWNSSLRSEGEEDNQVVEKNFLKQISLEEEVCKQYWDNLESSSLSLQNSFRPSPNGNGNGSVIAVMPSFNDDIHNSVEVITDSELQREIKKEADNSFEQTTIPSISVMEKANEQSWTSEDANLGIFSIKMEPSNNEANLYMEISTPQDLNPASSTSVSSSTSSSSSSSSTSSSSIPSSSSSSSSSSSLLLPSAVSSITPLAIAPTSTTTSSTTTTTTTTISGCDANGANLQNSDKIVLGELPTEPVGTKNDCGLELFCQQASVLSENINNICDSASDNGINHDISNITRLQDITSETNSSKPLQHNTTLNSNQSSSEIPNMPITSHSETLCLDLGATGSNIFSGQNSELSKGLLANKTLNLLDSPLPLAVGELRRDKNESNNSEAVPHWFQLYVQQYQQEAEIREKQLKDFQTKILELFKETNQQLATLIEVQKNEKMRQEKKDEEFRSNLLAILQENLKK
ncbi:serine-rich adhesin for platelets-like [Octopus sinensis]|uniref:Serine-rich adhesin for platelets-like n=1 Tax=Octopus sinensis TaxID=2607531 RepID=A0A6P7TAP9_9MOLL|nr:serine-rich adhesin for platelets-like [Octopus sinensis]